MNNNMSIDEEKLNDYINKKICAIFEKNNKLQNKKDILKKTEEILKKYTTLCNFDSCDEELNRKNTYYLDFLKRVFSNYITFSPISPKQSRKNEILNTVYIRKEMTQQRFIDLNYDNPKIYYQDKKSLLEDLSIHLFGISALDI